MRRAGYWTPERRARARLRGQRLWQGTPPEVRAEWQRKGRNAYYANHPERAPEGWQPEPPTEEQQ